MCLRESKQRRTDGSVVTYLQLAENVWDASKRRSQASVVHSRGRGDDPEVVEHLRRLAKSILRRCSPEEMVGAGGNWRLICACSYGDLYVLEAIWKQLGIDAVNRQQAGTRQLGFDVERALFALFANRACAPASKLYCHEQWLKEDAHIEGTQNLKLHPQGISGASLGLPRQHGRRHDGSQGQGRPSWLATHALPLCE